MFDLSLGGPVDEGEYGGPILRGEPLHEGSCFDSPTGCYRCNSAATSLSDEDLVAIGWETTNSCDWCKKSVSVRDIRSIRPSDEGGSVEYEVCSVCRDQQDKNDQEEYDYMFGVCESEQDHCGGEDHARCRRYR